MLDIKGNERFDSMDVKSVSIDESYPQERFYRKENDSHSCEVKNRHVNNIDRGKLNEKLDRLRDQEQILVNEIQKFKENTREMRKENIMEGQRFKINRNQNNHDNQINHNCAKNSQKAMDIPKSPTLNQNPGPKSNETLCKRDHRKKVTRSNSSGIVQNRIGDAYGDSKIKSSMRFSQEEINTKSNRQCKTNLSRSSDDINDLLTLRQEKVVLVQKLGYLEDKAHEIQTNVQKINREKDHLNELYNKSKEEIHRLKSELHHSKHNKCHTIKTKDCCSGANIFETTSKLNATLREIESEKEKALFNLSRVSAERDNVIAKYKRTLELANKDKKSLESYIDELKRVNQKLLDTKVFQEEEIKNRSTRERNLEDLVSQLEFDLKKRNEEINFEKESKQEIINQRDTTRNKFENLERDYINIQDQLKTHEKNLNQLESACKKLTTQQERDASKMKEMKSSYQKMEGEKKNFETLYRSAQDKLTVSDVNLKQLNNYIVEAKSQIALLERNSEIYQSQLSEKTCELNTCQSELSELKKFINESRMCMDSTERELTRFREENHLLMQENSKLASEINENVKIRAELEKNINEHVLSMPKLQKALEEMNNERCILSQQLQDAFEELKNWRFRWENCDKECNFFKSECEQMKGDFLRERDKNELLERDLIQIKSSLTSAEMQISSLNKISNDAQEKTREYQIEIEHMISEVNKLRDSIKKTNSTKSFLESDIINKQIEIDQLKSHIDELELNLQEQKEAVYHEKTQNRSLLKSVENDREKLGNCEKLLKDANKEILVMKDRLEDFKLKNTNLSKELSKMRMIFMEAERETNRLSKNLAQEKCEKERLISEARMNSLPSGYKPSGYLSNYMQTKNLEEDRLEDV